MVHGEIQRSNFSKSIRNVIKKGGMKAALTAAGSVVPGFGNIAGFAVGTAVDVLYGDKINQVVDETADSFIEDNVYEFNCPKCHHVWQENIELNKQSLLDESSSFTETRSYNSLFNKNWDYFCNNIDEISHSRKVLSTFVEVLDNDIDGSSVESPQLLYLKAAAILLYIMEEFDDEWSIKGKESTEKAISAYKKFISNDVPEEYEAVKAIFSIYGEDLSGDFAFGKVTTEYKRIIKPIHTEYLNAEYLSSCLDEVYYMNLVLLSEKAIEIGDFHRVFKLSKTILKIGTDQAKLYALAVLSWLYDDKEAKFSHDPKLSLSYANEFLNIVEGIKTKDKNHIFNTFELTHIKRCLGLCAIDCASSESDYFNPQKAINYANWGKDLGDPFCTYLLGGFYENGLNDGRCDNEKAKNYYKIALKMGYKSASDDLQRLETNEKKKSYPTGGTATEILSEKEKNYFESIKEFLEDDESISPRERKILDRLRMSLGISETRASEIESMLTTKITNEEQEYLDMFREYAGEGGLSEKYRRRLNLFASALGLSNERIQILEKMA